MNGSELIVIGIKASVLALRSDTGAQVWAKELKGAEFVSVVVEEGKVFAATRGEVFCLDLATGRSLWHNPLKGYGTGLVIIATEDRLRDRIGVLLAEKRRRDQEASESGATTVILNS